MNAFADTVLHDPAPPAEPASASRRGSPISLVQPVVWLLLYGALFRKIVEIPGFGAGSYIDFLTPGVVVMTALFSAGWSGMGLIDDLEPRRRSTASSCRPASRVAR